MDYVFTDDDGKVKLRVFFDGGDPELTSITKAISGAAFIDDDGVAKVRLYVAGSNVTPATGDAQPSHVLQDKTFTNQNGAQTGTMTDYTGTSPFHVQWVGGIPGQIRIQLPSGYFESGNPSEQVFIMDAAYIADNIAAGKEVFGLPGSFTSDADATAEDIAAGKTAYVNGVKITGTATITPP